WNNQRNQVIEDAKSYQHTNQYYTGAEDLDAYGHWVNVPGYNWCWTPYVDAGWIPYNNGRWAWEPYYGWTWVSAERWGWAPYHYGRWFNYGGSWCWWPGPVTPLYNPIWAPAYVSFFGFGGRFGVGVGFGFGGFRSIGWLPIGPCDPFFPWYGRGFGFRRGFGFNSVNVTNITNITNIRNINNLTRNRALPYVAPLAGQGRPVYSNLRGAVANTRVRRAIVTVPARDFASGRVTNVRRTIMSQSAVEHAQLFSGHVPVIPSRASLNPSGRTALRASLPSATVRNRRFFTVRQPAARPQTFNQEVAAVRQQLSANHPGSSAGRAALNMRRTDNAAARQTQTTAAARGTSSLTRTMRVPESGARQSFSRGSAVSGPSSRSHNQNAQPGWRSFGATGAARSVRSSGSAKPQAAQSFTARSASARTAARPGWQSFSNSAGRATGAIHSNPGRPSTSAGSANRQSLQPSARNFNRQSSISNGANGWRRFSAQPRQQFSNQGSPSSGDSFSRSSGRISQGYSRPPLDLQRSIVTPRSSGNGGYGGYRGAGGRSYTRSGGFSRGSGGGGYRTGAGGGHAAGGARSAPAARSGR
ncbi:MAG: DUF6600 domain-containing protein, partial [Terriglobia bacterium]